MKLLLLRHGLTDWNLQGRIQGHTDTPLCARGEEQVAAWQLPAQAAGAQWYVSPLLRARQTAALLGCTAPRLEPRLREMGWGDWEGATLAQLRAAYPREMREREARGLDFQPPGGESPRQVQARVLHWCGEVPDSRVVAVTHKGVIRAFYAAASGWDMQGKAPHRLDWNCAQLFEIDRGAARIERLNLDL